MVMLNELRRAAAHMGLRECVCLLAVILAMACWAEGTENILEDRRAGAWWWLELVFCAAAVVVAWM